MEIKHMSKFKPGIVGKNSSTIGPTEGITNYCTAGKTPLTQYSI
jgi:hypothetical protein